MGFTKKYHNPSSDVRRRWMAIAERICPDIRGHLLVAIVEKKTSEYRDMAMKWKKVIPIMGWPAL